MDERPRGQFRVDRRTKAAEAFEVAQRSPSFVPPPSTTLHRTLDPTIARQIAEIDPHLVVEWDPEGVWWIPASRCPRGVMERGAWHLSLRGVSGALRGMRMWPPECADGRLVDYLKATWGAYIFILRSQASDAQARRERIARLKSEKEKYDAHLFDSWWDTIDHGEMHRAVKELHNDPKWRGGWAVPDALVPGAEPPPAAAVAP